MEVSVICTVKNEEKSVKSLLDSLLNGIRCSDEIVIVDGGSSDKTVDVIESYAKINPIIKLIVEPGANISKGRNLAVKNAKYNIIACIDAGCTADTHWLKMLTEPFEKDPDLGLAIGYFLPDPKTKFEDVVGELLFPHLQSVQGETFPPATRSLAFKKTFWEAVGGFPERLYTAEDEMFVLKLKNKGFKFVFVPDAIMYTRPRENLRGLYKQYFLYSKGSIEANLNSTFVAYGENAFIYFFPILVNYIIRLIKKMDFVRLIYIPAILAAVLLGKINGTIAGKRSAIRVNVRD